MAKKFYRFLRGELNGHYLTSMYNVLNITNEDISSFLAHFVKMQFNTTDMTEEEIYNLGKFAGVYIPRLSGGDAYGAFRMTESHEVDGVQRSERGLLERENEKFEFFHTEQDEYEDDINTLATNDLRSSLVGDEEVLGFISSNFDGDVVDNNGNVKEEAIEEEPPEDVAYTDFYGNQFTFLAEGRIVKRNIPTALFFPLLKVMQYIRYNGASIASLCDIINILCPNGLVKIDSIVKHSTAPVYIVNHTYDESVEVSSKIQRYNTLLYVVQLKFPQFVMNSV